MSESNRIFISYARTDAKIAQALADQLDAIGISYWIDYANLAIGEDWTKTIAAALHNADGIVILSSAQSSMSDWVAREIRFAVKCNVTLLRAGLSFLSGRPPLFAAGHQDAQHHSFHAIVIQELHPSGPSRKTVPSWQRGAKVYPCGKHSAHSRSFSFALQLQAQFRLRPRLV